MGIKETGFSGRFASFREGLRSEKATNGFSTDLESSRDFTLTEPLLVERTDSLIPTIAVGTADLRACLCTAIWNGPSASELRRHASEVSLWFCLLGGLRS